MKRRSGNLEYHLLLLVTLGLVAFGLVMVYSASSGRAAVAAGDPAYYLKRQALYAALGLVALAVLSRIKFRSLRYAGGPLLLASFGLLVAVLVMGTAVNGARRWLSLGIVDFQPSELAKLAVVLWVAGMLARRPAPGSLSELAKPIGLTVLGICALVLAEPDLGTAIAIVLTVAAMLVVAGTPMRVLGSRGRDRRRARARGDLARAVPARAAAVASSIRGRTRRARASRPSRRSSRSARAAFSASGSARASRRSTSCRNRRRT